jgi:hypothetical protein
VSAIARVGRSAERLTPGQAGWVALEELLLRARGSDDAPVNPQQALGGLRESRRRASDTCFGTSIGCAMFGAAVSLLCAPHIRHIRVSVQAADDHGCVGSLPCPLLEYPQCRSARSRRDGVTRA